MAASINDLTTLNISDLSPISDVFSENGSSSSEGKEVSEIKRFCCCFWQISFAWSRWQAMQMTSIWVSLRTLISWNTALHLNQSKWRSGSLKNPPVIDCDSGSPLNLVQEFWWVNGLLMVKKRFLPFELMDTKVQQKWLCLALSTHHRPVPTPIALILTKYEVCNFYALGIFPSFRHFPFLMWNLF